MTSKFLTGKELINVVDEIIWSTEQTLFIVSPFIKLDTHFKRLFEKHLQKPSIHILIVFGKNENEITRSLSMDDFDYFKTFPNISIIYEPTLHAKYYGNEKKGVITSINLYDSSFKTNIEFGIYSERNVINQLISNPDEAAWHKCFEIANNGTPILIKRPVYENKKFIINIGKNYLKSDTLHDLTPQFYGNHFRKKNIKKLQDFPHYIDFDSYTRPTRDEIIEEPKRKSYNKTPETGYCIRTGEKIKFNPKQPLSRSAWLVWNEYGNIDFKENYCHKTGKPSNGKTSMRNPILYNN